MTEERCPTCGGTWLWTGTTGAGKYCTDAFHKTAASEPTLIERLTVLRKNFYDGEAELVDQEYADELLGRTIDALTPASEGRKSMISDPEQPTLGQTSEMSDPPSERHECPRCYKWVDGVHTCQKRYTRKEVEEMVREAVEACKNA